MKYEVRAQSNDAIVMTIEANDIFDAADKVAEEFDVDIAVDSNRKIITFETESDYYDLYQIA